MGARLGGVAVVLVVLAVGVFLGSAFSRGYQAPEASSGSPLPVRVVRERVRVEVLNGGGRDGVARAATDVLREDGFDVVYFGNAPAFDQDSSVVVDRVGRLDLARSVADALGIPRVSSQPDSNLYLDVTVLLGEDWTRPAPDPGQNPRPSWWDPRRWFGANVSQLRGPLADPGREGG